MSGDAAGASNTLLREALGMCLVLLRQETLGCVATRANPMVRAQSPERKAEKLSSPGLRELDLVVVSASLRETPAAAGPPASKVISMRISSGLPIVLVAYPCVP